MRLLCVVAFWLLTCSFAAAQQTDSRHRYFAEQTQAVSERASRELAAVTPDSWPEIQTQWREELKEMLGLAPWPEKSDLQVTTTGSIALADVNVDRLHYQARPGLYVAANLYQPTGKPPAEGWPAVLYVCGHARVSEQGRLLGNKTNYQHHGLWLARHGVVCLTIDTTQLGEFHGEHHGTYKLGRWDWISRGYTPAGVEAWNAIRGVDLLCDLPDVNPARIGITGRSGGGAYSWFAAALDERIRVAVPVAGITDLHNHVVDGCVAGHCDCMYFVNYFGWDYGKLAALIAPRALLLANSDSDGIFPLDGVMRIHDQLNGVYQRLGASDKYGVLITPGPHKDTQELQVGAFKWLLKNLRDESEPVIDSAALKELEPAALAVFEAAVPRDERVTSVSGWFVPEAKSVQDGPAAAELWETAWRPQLQRLGTLPTAQETQFNVIARGEHEPWSWELLQGEQDSADIQLLRAGARGEQPPLIHLLDTRAAPWDAQQVPAALESAEIIPWLERFPDREHYFVRWRGADWMATLPDAHQQTMLVRRFYLLGQTPEEVMLADLLTATRWIHQNHPNGVELAGAGRLAALVELAALLAVADDAHPAETRMVKSLHVANRTTDPLLAPALPGLLRVCDYASLHAVAAHLMPVEELSFEAHTSELLVDTHGKPQQATGMRIVEVGQTRARVWVRATRWPLPNLGDLPEVQFKHPAASGKANRDPILPEQGVEGLRFAAPGVAAQVRVGIRPRGGAWRTLEWQAVDGTTDYSAVVDVPELTAGTHYDVRTEVRAPDGDSSAGSSLSGSFRTLPAADASGSFKLAIGTCQDFDDRDGPHGFDAYRAMLARHTDAFVMAGDVVYYDALARNNELAFYHWQRTYALPTLIEFHRRVPTYFLKDDHDTYVDDTGPSSQLPWTGEFTFADGQRIFQEQTGLPTPAYRTFSVTDDLQVWLMEGRDYRSPNQDPDGPDKSIWGGEQKKWLEQTMKDSTAKFRVVISPTPLVGPDRDKKNDNHSNKGFETEGLEVRKMLAKFPNTISVCGDRHWQYHSIDPETGLHEFSVGPISDRHAGGWRQDDFRPEIHQFLRVEGGYLELELAGQGATRALHVRHFDTRGGEQHEHVLR